MTISSYYKGLGVWLLNSTFFSCVKFYKRKIRVRVWTRTFPQSYREYRFEQLWLYYFRCFCWFCIWVRRYWTAFLFNYNNLELLNNSKSREICCSLCAFSENRWRVHVLSLFLSKCGRGCIKNNTIKRKQIQGKKKRGNPITLVISGKISFTFLLIGHWLPFGDHEPNIHLGSKMSRLVI